MHDIGTDIVDSDPCFIIALWQMCVHFPSQFMSVQMEAGKRYVGEVVRMTHNHKVLWRGWIGHI